MVGQKGDLVVMGDGNMFGVRWLSAIQGERETKQGR